MSWRDSLRAASWRGVAFQVEAASGSFGRRTARHEYPQRDTPAIEDLGRATREISISAFVIGDDYMGRRDALIAAAEKPGAGVLQHPYLGRMRVVCEEFTVGETSEEGRMARIGFSFIEAGELSFPTGITVGAAEAAAADVKDAAKSDFLSRFSLAEGLSLTTRAVDIANGKVLDLQDALGAPGAFIDDVATVQRKLSVFLDNIESLLATPSDFADEFETAISLSDDLSSYEDILGDGTGDDEIPNQTTEAEKQEEANRSALQRLYWRNALAGAVLALLSKDFMSYDDAVSARDKIAGRIATEAEVDASSPTSFEALSYLRTSIFEDITKKASDLSKLRKVSTNKGAALVLAYELYQDAERADEIVDRNKVPNGAFLYGDLLVLSE